MSTITARGTEQVEGFAAQLRGGTRAAHERAEGTGFVAALTAGSLDRPAIAAYTAALHTVYVALELTAVAMARRPVASRFVDRALERVPALERDLDVLVGADWRDRVQGGPAATAYRDHVLEVCPRSEEAFVAHHYTRYLGDLSGGRIVGAMLAKHYGLDGTTGLAFYEFPDIPEPVPYKRRYRDLLDAVPWDEGQRQASVAEANVAFELNARLLDELGANFVAPARA